MVELFTLLEMINLKIAILHSGDDWHEYWETSSKFFLNLENKNKVKTYNWNQTEWCYNNNGPKGDINRNTFFNRMLLYVQKMIVSMAEVWRKTTVTIVIPSYENSEHMYVMIKTHGWKQVGKKVNHQK